MVNGKALEKVVGWKSWGISPSFSESGQSSEEVEGAQKRFSRMLLDSVTRIGWDCFTWSEGG